MDTEYICPQIYYLLMIWSNNWYWLCHSHMITICVIFTSEKYTGVIQNHVIICILFSDAFTLVFVDEIGANYQMVPFSYMDNDPARNLTVWSMEHCALQCLGMTNEGCRRFVVHYTLIGVPYVNNPEFPNCFIIETYFTWLVFVTHKYVYDWTLLTHKCVFIIRG